MRAYVYEVECSNTQLTGENRTYLVLATSAGGAEARAVSEMNHDLNDERGVNYATSVRLLGPLLKAQRGQA